MKKRRVLSTREKESLVRRLEAGERVGALAKQAGVLRKSLYEWRAAYRAMGVAGFNRKRGPKPGGRRFGWSGGRASIEPAAAAAGSLAARPPDNLTLAKARIAELERLVGRQQTDLYFFREALRSWDARKPKSCAPTSSRWSQD
jgi:transposase-like protein